MNHRTFGALLGVAPSALAAPLPGKTLTNGSDLTLQKDIPSTIDIQERVFAPRSKTHRVVATAITVAPPKSFKSDAQGKAILNWPEAWTVKRDDGTTKTYSIRFFSNGAAGTMFSVSG